jgi:AcrR family transcriptional regulator
MPQCRLNHGILAIVSIRPSDPRLLLIEVAERQFATGGFAATTVHLVATLAGVRDHMIYSLFGSKAGLLREIEAARSGGALAPRPGRQVGSANASLAGKLRV